MRKNLINFATASLLVSSSAWAQSSSVDVKKSKIEWQGRKVIGDSHNGTITLKSGSINFEKGVPTKGEVVVDMNSIVNLDLKDPNWNAKLVGHLKSDDFFGVKKYPVATLKINSFKKSTGHTYTIAGDMTLRGVTKPVKATATLNADSLVAEMKFDRTDFQVKYASGKFFKSLGDKMIADEISIKATIIVDKNLLKQSSL